MVRKIGRFELGRTLGEGRFSKVKFGIDGSTGERVAVKIMSKEALVKLDSVERVKVEIEILKTVHHPHIVNLVEVMASETDLFIVMELMTGGELLEKLATMRRFDEITARHYFVQLIQGVAYCHSKGVYHRDLKPENLLLDDDENLKIADFGLAAFAPPTDASLLRYSQCGTPNYVSPEVLLGNGYRPGPADMWSCGVILFVFLAGHLPFDEPTDEILFDKICSAQFKMPKYFSPLATQLVRKLLDPNPQTRITLAKLKEDPWFSPPDLPKIELSVLPSSPPPKVPTRKFIKETVEIVKPEISVAGRPITNAFELIAVSGALDISTLLQGKKLSHRSKHTRFCSKHKGSDVFQRLRDAISTFSYEQKLDEENWKIIVSGIHRRGPFQYTVEMVRITREWHMVAFHRNKGTILAYNSFFRNVCRKVQDIIWQGSTPIREENQTNTAFLRMPEKAGEPSTSLPSPSPSPSSPPSPSLSPFSSSATPSSSPFSSSSSSSSTSPFSSSSTSSTSPRGEFEVFIPFFPLSRLKGHHHEK